MKTIKFKLKPGRKIVLGEKTLELIKTPNDTSSTFDSNPINDMDSENQLLKNANEWYQDPSNGIFYPKSFLDEHYDEIK
ncbi:MAG: hypothetical protein IK084_01470 [Bacteroidaceae bacterium]|nr:hypothetical protein [Bacteroidaceae bacterium]